MNKLSNLFQMFSGRMNSDRQKLQQDKASQQYAEPTRRQPATGEHCENNESSRGNYRMVDRQSSDAARKLWCTAEHF